MNWLIYLFVFQGSVADVTIVPAAKYKNYNKENTLHVAAALQQMVCHALSIIRERKGLATVDDKQWADWVITKSAEDKNDFSSIVARLKILFTHGMDKI